MNKGINELINKWRNEGISEGIEWVNEWRNWGIKEWMAGWMMVEGIKEWVMSE